MSDAHKKALSQGRAQGKAVRDYLAALESSSRPAGRRPTLSPAQIQERIDAEPDPAKRVDLIQRRMDVQARLAAEADEPDLATLERGFVKVAKRYADRKGISYMAFRELGVPAAVLKDAGIARTRRTS